ncbi:hypothetical protein OO009_12810 [Flavobacteriaceae bacterium KMM 6897]|nr:hypothetical protein [Flavobacteriaceae bacterium KMM 6897]
MKNSFNISKLTGVVLMALLVLASCAKDESPIIVEEATFDVAELTASDEAELISEEITNIGEDVYAMEEIKATSKANYTSNYLPDCVTITTVVTSTTKLTTIDFGEGCELPNGNLLSGIILLNYAKDMEMASKTIALSLDDFTFNGVAVEGSSSLLRMRSNDNGNPQSEAVANYSGVWPDGYTANFTGNRTREWIEGYGSGFWGDNVFLISGQGTYTGKMGNVFSKEIVTALRRELSCRFLVSGVLEISKNDATARLDFGDGTCDAKGSLTYPNGEVEEILLRRFNRK